MAVGVLALQGSYNEHIAALRRIGVKGVEIRKPEQLRGVDSLIIPGGESTTMAKLAELHNLGHVEKHFYDLLSPLDRGYHSSPFPALREFVGSGNPVWGTCAGLIFLANKAVGQKTGGQELVGGLDCTVHRNFFGSQLQSFETELLVPKLAEKEGGTGTCRGVFIRAPAILEVGPNVEVIADLPVSSDQPRVVIPAIDGQEEKEFTDDRVIVAIKQGNLLATAFHPELTSDSRWHRYFMAMVEEAKQEATPSEVLVKYDLYANDGDGNAIGKRPHDLPIFE